MFNTRVRLFDNVPFSLDYAHTRWFNSISEQQTYFNSLNPKETHSNGRAIRIIDGKGEIKITGHSDFHDYFNYVIIENRLTDNTDNRIYYCFVNSVEYVNSDLMKINFEVDVLQTFMFDMVFKPSFVERHHSLKNTVTEEVNLGYEYITRSSQYLRKPIDQVYHTLLVVTTKALDGDGTLVNGVVNGIASPLHHYLFLLPKDDNAPSITVNDIKLYGTASTSRAIARLIFRAFYDEETANTIVNISYLPVFPFETSISGYAITLPPIVVNSMVGIVDMKVADNTFKTLKLAQDTVSSGLSFNIGKLSNLLSLSNVNIDDPKLKQSPYLYLTLYDGLGNSFDIRPELLDYPDDDILIYVRTSYGASPKVSYIVAAYKGSVLSINNALISTVNADIEIINDHTATYFQGRRNSDRVASTQSAVGAISQGALGVGMALVAGAIGQPLGVVSGAGMLVGAINNGFHGQQQILSKHEDVSNLPPTLLNQGGLSNQNIMYDDFSARVEVRCLLDDNLTQIQDFFKQFGYATKKLVQPNLRTKTRFNFVKTIGANIVGEIPQNYIIILKSIFDQGITLWHVNDMYNYSLANNER